MPDGALSAHLRYLDEKGFARVERKEGFGFSIAFATLTASGWDFIDGHIADRGIDSEL